MSEFRYIQVKSADIRSAPSFLSQRRFRVAYTNKVTLLETRGSWANVSYHGNAGWVHQSAISTRVITLDPNAATARAQVSDDEISLAGKGFNKEVENTYRDTHGDAGFSDVDKAEAIRLDPASLAKFMKAGGLTPQGEEI
ncbi:SH3 domain-containing protein [uncultured Desulfobacter sp.]|uniref:SH3 domain-containing protein n=1 Tax=uncultured Desulfobacter sp. TaxID=240139 RepID=UPI002AAA8689|nr:SH3 domain-containing protein [uncultured Desulfobacter sp.]